MMVRTFLLALAVLAASCDRAPRRAAPASAPDLVRRPAAARIVAVGDLHGDLAAMRAALRLGGVIDEADHWSGGQTVLVQLGDQLDRGDDEPEILTLLELLAGEAAAAGGAVITLNGNHELMNVAADFRYVTDDGLRDYEALGGRRAAFAPGAPLARSLAERPIYAIVGASVFVHGGVTPAQARRLERLDRDARAWLRGERQQLPDALTDDGSPIWDRSFGLEVDAAGCAEARAALAILGVSRMVIAHTTQPHANAVCDGAVWRIDVGLARVYGGPIEVLLIEDDVPRVLRGVRP